MNENLGLNSACSKDIVNRPDQVVFNNLPTVRIKKTWESINLKDRGGGDFDCLVSGEEKGVVGLVGLEPTI